MSTLRLAKGMEKIVAARMARGRGDDDPRAPGPLMPYAGGRDEGVTPPSLNFQQLGEFVVAVAASKLLLASVRK